MDKKLRDNIEEALEKARLMLGDDIPSEFAAMDPVAKLMVVALMGEVQKINDYIDGIDERIAERFCSDFIPWEEVQAMPGLTMLHPTFKKHALSEQVQVANNASFTMKDPSGNKPMKYVPLLSTNALPYTSLTVYTWRRIVIDGTVRQVFNSSGIEKNVILLGITTDCEIESIEGLTLMFEHFHEKPERITIGKNYSTELEFAPAREMERMVRAYPFDAQQFSERHIAIVREWKRLLSKEDTPLLLYITDKTNDRDVFKPYSLARNYSQWMESDVQDAINADKTVWLRIEFDGNCQIPDECNVRLNVFPVANVNVDSLTLTQNEPIKAIDGKDGEFFLGVLETSNNDQKKGYAPISDEIIIRDYDASCYNNAALERDIRNLYNRFKDDYMAFADYNNIRNEDGLKRLRKIIVDLQKTMEEEDHKNQFDSGTYVMKRWDKTTTSSKVTFMTTNGYNGNAPKKGDRMDNKSTPALEPKIEVVIDASGGRDKLASRKGNDEKAGKKNNERRELLRYYTLTDDRLYTKMDIDAFLRKEIMVEFGESEFDRIFINIHIEGTGGEQHLQRGLYINISFKDKKNYQKAMDMEFAKRMQQRISERSCIAMPIFVNLVNLEE